MYQYNRYGDASKFIDDINKLSIDGDNCVYISNEDDYDICVCLDNADNFQKLKPFIINLTKYVCQLDNMAQKFDSIYSPNSHDFPYELMYIYVEKNNVLRFEYWGTYENTVFDVTFCKENDIFKLKSFGTVKDISDEVNEKIKL